MLILLILLFQLTVLANEVEPRKIEVTRRNSICVCNEFTPMLIFNLVIQTALKMDKVEYIIINSNGGYTAVIYPIQHLLLAYPDATVVIVNAMSSAAFLSVRLPNKKKVVASDGLMLFHKIFVTKNVDEAEHVRLKILNYVVMHEMARLMSMNYVDYKNKVLNGDWVLAPQEVVSRKIADELVFIDDTKY